MKIGCFIPIKSYSERVPGKNFRKLNGKKLYEYVLEHVIESDIFDTVYVDTDSDELKGYCLTNDIVIINRKKEYVSNSINGNDLIYYHYTCYPEFDFYFQLFATAPYMQPITIKNCVEKLVSSNNFDSCFTAVMNHGFYWLGGSPVNYRPNILPRSQDLTPMIEETTGLYGIKRESLEKYRCRIGAKPYIHVVNKFEAIDINTEFDLKMAEYVGRLYWNYGDGDTQFTPPPPPPEA
ncbi:MAG: acylneuraminate cytidylyltransferase family protein [Clostridiales bacterium]|jgi:N-acylneuraminate cytidylyltransferase|nr:acylneuraminate cytidylyltransferase family protein [Clostridiales bacterium]